LCLGTSSGVWYPTHVVTQKKPITPKKQRPAWLSMVQGGQGPPTTSLDELREMKDVHGLLTAPIAGPPALAYAIQSFRLFQMFGITSVSQNRPPSLRRCWTDLEALFMTDRSEERRVGKDRRR